MTKTQLAIILGFALLVSGCNSDSSQPVETFQNPSELKSTGGELRASLTVGSAQIRIGDRSVTSSVYNGAYSAPLLRVRPGDTLFVDVDNRIGEQTNLHMHGLNVSPRINADATVSDNVFVSVDPATKLSYKFEIPKTHNAGLYWYHAHLHEKAQRQLMEGLSGAIIIDGVLDPLPQFRNAVERIMLLKDIQVTAQGAVPTEIKPGGSSVRTVNGLVNPTMVIRPHETQFLRIANIGSDVYYSLRLQGHKFYELARDGNQRTRVVALDEILLSPGSRSEVLIQGAEAGTYLLTTQAFSTGPDGDSYPLTTLATVVSQGAPDVAIPIPGNLPAVEDFRTLPIAKRRVIRFSSAQDNFFVDSGNGPKAFNANLVDSTILAGTVEEWTIINTTQELHTFHIHQTDFQVTEINGAVQEFLGHQDNVDVPFQASANAVPGEIKVLIDFRNPNMVGKFVYHCHILEHEDAGMMAVAEVVPSGPFAMSLKAKAMRVVNRIVGGAAAERAAQSEATLNALQAGSFCRSPLSESRVTPFAVRGTR